MLYIFITAPGQFSLTEMEMKDHSLFVSIHFMTSKNQVSPYTQVNFMIREVSFFAWFSLDVVTTVDVHVWGREVISKNSTTMHVTHGYYSDLYFRFLSSLSRY